MFEGVPITDRAAHPAAPPAALDDGFGSGLQGAGTRIRALLFDLDGTLVDTAAANFAAYARALAEVGVVVDRPTFSRVADGRNWRQFIPEMLAREGVTADPETVARRKTELYAGLVGGLRLNTALLSLASASRATMATGLVTTASGVNARAVLAQHGLEPLFDVIVTGDDVTQHKPHPEAYLLAVSRLGVRPDECLAFEDSEIGLTSARAAGIGVVQVVL